MWRLLGLAVALVCGGALAASSSASASPSGPGAPSAAAPATGPGGGAGGGGDGASLRLAGFGGGGGPLGGGIGGGAGGLGGWPASVFHHRPIYTQQSLGAVLAAIEERLRALDALYAARLSPRLEPLPGADPYGRRLDSLDARLARLETLLDLRLDKLSETMSSRGLKEELAKDQLSRSVDATFERMHHRLGFMETRLDVALSKLQASLDTLSTRVERLDMGLGSSGGGGGGGAGHFRPGGGSGGADVGADLQLVKTGLDELRNTVRDNHDSLLNSTLTAVSASESVMQRHYERLSTALNRVQEELNRTLTVQNDGGGGGGGEQPHAQPLRHERHGAAGSLLGAVERHAAGVSAKVTNMYNELWRRTQVLEGLSKDAMALSNATRRELQEGMRSVSMQLSRYCSLQADKARPGPNGRDNVEATLEEIRSSMSSYFQTIISTQHMFQDTCHRIQEYEPLLEKYLAETLERIVSLISNNKCQSQVEDLHRLLKSHHSTVVRNVGHTTNTIMRAANNNSKEAQHIASAINEAHDGLQERTSDIQRSISGVKNEQQTVHQTLKELASVMNDLHLKVVNLTNGSTEEETEFKIIPCQVGRIEAVNVTSELKQIFKDNQIHISKEIQNLTASIKEILTNLGVQWTSGHKLQGNTETVERNFVNPITDSSEQNYDDTSENGVILEAHEENLNAIYDSQKAQTESVLHNFTHLHAKPPKSERRKSARSQALSQMQTSTSQYSDEIYEDNPSSELTINVMPKSSQEIRINHSSEINSSDNILKQTYGSNELRSGDNKNASDNATYVTVVHNDRPLTSEGHITYSSLQNQTNNTETQEINQLNRRNSQERPLTQSQLHTHSLHSHHDSRNQHRTNSTAKENSNGIIPNKDHIPTAHSSLNGLSRTHSQEYINKTTDHYTDAYTNNHTEIDASRKGNHVENMSKKHTHTSGTHNVSKTPNVTNRSIIKDTRHRNVNKNDTQHYLYHLINKLEELSNRLMNSESREASESDGQEPSENSQESSEEYHDFSQSEQSNTSN